MYNHSNMPIKAENNSWGYYNRREVTSTIFDAANDAQYGAVDFVPFIRQKERSDLDDYLVMMMDPVSTQAPPLSTPEDQQEDTADTVKPEEQIPEQRPEEKSLAALKMNVNPLKAEQNRSLVNVPAENQNNKPAETPAAEDNPVEKKIEPEPLASASNTDTEEDLRIPPPREEKKQTPQVNYDQVFLEPFLDNKREIIRKKAPSISDSKWGLGAKGIVQIRIIVGKDGRVESAQILRGLNNYYDRISKEAAEQFQFKPGTIKGNAVRFSTNLFFEF
jgi:TonB family protein